MELRIINIDRLAGKQFIIKLSSEGNRRRGVTITWKRRLTGPNLSDQNITLCILYEDILLDSIIKWFVALGEEEKARNLKEKRRKEEWTCGYRGNIEGT